MPRIKKTWKAGVLQTFDWYCRFFLSPDPTGNIWDKFKTPQKASSNCGFVIIYCLFASGSRRFFFCLCMGDFLQSGIALLALPHPDGNWSFVSQKISPFRQRYSLPQVDRSLRAFHFNTDNFFQKCMQTKF